MKGQTEGEKIRSEAPRDDEGNIIWDDVPVTFRIKAGAFTCRLLKDENDIVIGIG